MNYTTLKLFQSVSKICIRLLKCRNINFTFLGLRVVGFAGTDEKCEYLEKELGFDRVFNYKTVDIRAALKEGAPKRVDCYFDNVRKVYAHTYSYLYTIHIIYAKFVLFTGRG